MRHLANLRPQRYGFFRSYQIFPRFFKKKSSRRLKNHYICSRMLYKTRGIVLHSLPYNDNYVIITIYTEEFGRMAYMVASARSRKTSVARALLQPFSVLDLEVEHQNNRDIHRIKEAKSNFIISQIRHQPVKNAIALFLSEVLYRTIQEKEANRALFDFLYRSINWLEIADDGIANFHLTFLLQLASFIGIRPGKKVYRENTYFDLLNGIFSETIPSHPHYLNQSDSIVFARLLRMNYENMALYTFTGRERSVIVRHIIDYFRLHLSDFPEIKSLAVMSSLFE